ncbi:MAG TPA: metallopeptidase family protein [Actinomycetota bacterium]|jgi:predicted Zn-dependent protease with MMP-like domain
MNDERFEELVAEALDGLPEWVHERLSNVAVLVEDRAPRGRRSLLGLYEGIAQTERGDWYSGALPDRITLFRDTLEREARGDPERLRRVVAHTVAHEIAHHFGISDERLRELGVY